MSSKQKTLFQTWNKDFKDPGPSTSKSNPVNRKKPNTSKTGRKKRNPWEKKPSNQEDDTSDLWKKNINIPSLQQDFREDSVEETSNAHPEFDLDAGKTWIYPTNYPLREYQFAIVKQALFKNTLVILPTGLGKTFIAAVVMYNIRRWYPNGKVVFMAPTRPLVAQQVDACFKIMGIPQDDTALMTGTMLPGERKRIWQTKHVFFLTPQILTNDLARNICSPYSIKCLVVDEAHKALGNHAYCQVVKDLRSRTSQFRVLALTATPGGDTEAVRQVLENLLISHVELRTDDCNDIKPYTFERNVEKIVIPLGEDLTYLKNKFLDMISTYLKRLNQRHTITNRNPSSLSQFFLCKLRDDFDRNLPPNINRYTRGLILADFSLCISLYHAYDLLLLHGVKPFYIFLTGVLNGEKGIPHSRAELQKNEDFEEIMKHIRENYAMDACDEHSVIASVASTSKAPTNFVPGHPKLVKLKEIVLNHFQSAAGCGSQTRIMIFSQYRESVKEITEMLKGHEPLIRVMSFIGQASSTNSKGGISQKQQLKIVSDFREGGYNTLVSTCVGEEGLDIGEVDLIICYDAPKSPIRLVQRMGRTGRRRQGKIVVLLAEGKEEQMYNSSQYKKRNIFRAIKNGFDQIPLYQNNPAMIPNGVKPQCVKMFMEIEPKRPVLSKREKNKLRKVCSFFSDEEFLYFLRHYKAPAHSSPTLAKPEFISFLNKEQLKKLIEDEIFGKNEPENPVLSVTNWMPWQNVLQHTHLVPHSANTHTFVNILQLIENPEAAVKHFEYSEEQMRKFEILFPDDRLEGENFQAEVEDSDQNALINAESYSRDESEVTVIAEIPRKKPMDLFTSHPPPVDSGNKNLYSKFDLQTTSTGGAELCEKDFKKAVIKPAPRVTHKPFAINAQSVLEFDVREIIPFESKDSLLSSKTKGLFSQPNPVVDEVMNLQVDDSFFDFAAFDLNFDRDSPPVLVSLSPNHVKVNEKSAVSGDDFTIPKDKNQESFATRQGNLTDKDTGLNFSPEKVESQEKNRTVPDVHATVPTPSCAARAKTNAEQTQFSLTQLASLVDYSEAFADVEKDVDHNHDNVADDVAFSGDADVEFESDEDFISPTPPESIKSSAATTRSQLFSYQNVAKTRPSQNSPTMPDNRNENETVSRENENSCSQILLRNNGNSVCILPSSENSSSFKDLKNSKTMGDVETEFSQPDFSPKEIGDSIFFDIAFDSQLPAVEENYFKCVAESDDRQNNADENVISEVSGNGSSPHVKTDTAAGSHFLFSEKESSLNDSCSLLHYEASSIKCHVQHPESPDVAKDCASDVYLGCLQMETTSVAVANSSENGKTSKCIHPETSVTAKAEKSYKTLDNKLSKKTVQQNRAVAKDKRIIENDTHTELKQVFSPGSDFDDFKIPPRPKKMKPADKGLPACKSKNLAKEVAKEYIISEADVSDLHSGSDSTSEDSTLDQMEASFIDDSTFVDQQVDQHGLYLRSIKNHHGLPQKYKLQANHVVPDEDIYSQPPERESSGYLADSFVVENDEIELLTSSDESVHETGKSKKKKRKRKRIIQPACSSSSETEDLDCGDRDPQRSKMAKFSVNESEENENLVSIPRSSTPNAELLMFDFDDFREVPYSPPVRAIRKKRRGPVKQLEASCLESEVVSDLNENQHGFKVTPDTCNPAFNVYGVADGTNTLSPEKISFDISWTNNQADWVPDNKALELLFPETSSVIQVESDINVQKPALSQGPDCLTVLVDSKELASGKPVINCLRNQFDTNAVVMQLSGADYILSKELAIERLLETEFPASPLHSKAVEKVQTMCQLYDRCCVIIEKDGRKQSLGRKPRGKHLEFTLLVLLSTSVKVFHSESPENTAFLLFELAKREKDKGLGISIPSNLLSVKKHFLEFCSSLPQVSTICSINFANNCNTLEELLKSSVEDLQRMGHISRHVAYRIHSYFMASMKM